MDDASDVGDDLDCMSWTQLRELIEAMQREIDRLNAEIVRLRNELLDLGRSK
jgi:uncharacterized small protein (DUF1192 family)